VVGAGRQVRAGYDEREITVYQAYGPRIAAAALAAGTFLPPFKVDRMTWVKPSFMWMMYRSDWATKPGQEWVLAVRIARAGFDWALANSCLSHYDRDVYDSSEQWREACRSAPVRIQWDPDRSIRLEPLSRRAIQVGLRGEAVRRYLTEWIVGIADVTPLARQIHELVRAGEVDRAQARLPAERPYPLPAEIAARIGASQ